MKTINFQPGDKIELKTKTKTWEGHALESFNPEIVLLKLKSGYNIGIRENEILDAKKVGLERYDFWGISDSNPVWKGITRFKLGFGGERLSYPGTYDYVIKPLKYKLYKLLRALRRR